MPIKVVCQCGQRFKAKDSLAGKSRKCPKCGGVLVKLLRVFHPEVGALIESRLEGFLAIENRVMTLNRFQRLLQWEVVENDD